MVFNLSEKILISGVRTDPDYLLSKDVKEFIKLLKDHVRKNYWKSPSKVSILEEIDKLAGDELNGK